MSVIDPPIIIETGKSPVASVIWLHGLGADGHDFEAIVPELKLPAAPTIRFIFPHAPMRPITINGGMVMRGWYDVMPGNDGFTEDNDHIRDAADYIRLLVEQEQGRGIAVNRIILAGFSQGGAVALYTGLGFEQPLAGIMALSAYVPMFDSMDSWLSKTAKDVPVFQAHGLQDPLISVRRAEHSRTLMIQHDIEVDWHSYSMEHSVCAEEVGDICRWITSVLTDPVDADVD